MARPDPATKAARAERKAKWATVRAEAKAADEAVRVQVASISAGALVAQKESPGPITLDEVAAKLRAAYDLAMATSQPGHATNAALALAKVGGFLIEKQQVMQGTPQEFTEVQSREEMLARLTDKYGEVEGPIVAKNMKQFLDRTRKQLEDARAAAAGYEILEPAGFDDQGRWRPAKKRWLSVEDPGGRVAD